MEDKEPEKLEDSHKGRWELWGTLIATVIIILIGYFFGGKEGFLGWLTTKPAPISSSTVSSPPPSPATTRLTGIVRNSKTGLPIGGAMIILQDIEDTSYTDEKGLFIFNLSGVANTNQGIWATISKQGFRDWKGMLSFKNPNEPELSER